MHGMWTYLYLHDIGRLTSEPLIHTGISGFSYLLAKCSKDITLGGSFSFVKAVDKVWGSHPFPPVFWHDLYVYPMGKHNSTQNRRSKGARRRQDKVLPLCFTVREAYRKVQSFSWE